MWIPLPQGDIMNFLTWLTAALLPAFLATAALAENHEQSPAPAQANGATLHGDSHVPVVFTLRTGIANGRMVYIGFGGDIAGKVNPTLKVHEGETVQINLINGEGAEHDIVFDQFAARSDRVVGKGASSILSFTADKTGDSTYYCSLPGHREAGMEGKIEVIPGPRAGLSPVLPISSAIPPICLGRSMSGHRKWCASIWRRSNSSASSTTKPPITTGPSTEKCRVRFSGCGWATRSRFTSRTAKTA